MQTALIEGKLDYSIKSKCMGKQKFLKSQHLPELILADLGPASLLNYHPLAHDINSFYDGIYNYEIYIL